MTTNGLQPVQIVVQGELREEPGLATCPWLVEVPSGNPEPDFPEDTYVIVECGAGITLTYEGQGWECEAGHRHIPIEIALAPFGPEFQREQDAR